MKNTLKFILMGGVMAAAVLACTSVTGSSSSSSPDLLFEDDFSDTGSGWDRFEDELTFTDYGNGDYRIRVFTENYFAWATPYKDFGDVIIEVDATKLSGVDENDIGIICKHKDIDNFYALIMGPDGYALIARRIEGGDIEPLTDWQESGAINTGNARNHLRAECVGGRLALYVNGELAVETFDNSISSGDAGLIGGTNEDPNLEISFDNFMVRKPAE